MLNQGIVQLPNGFFPALPSEFTEEEKKNMLILTGFDTGSGLSLIQTVPELMAENKCLAYSATYKPMIDLYYPIIKSAMNDEFIHARVIAMLNNATGESKELEPYKVTFLFICDDSHKNFKLAGIFTGETNQGQWIPKESLAGFSMCLSIKLHGENIQ